MKLKVALLSRLNPPNVGHILMHDGVDKLLESAAKKAGMSLETVHYEQHRPLRYLYSNSHPARWLDALPDWPPYKAKITRPIKRILEYSAISRQLWRTVAPGIKTVDMAVACGGPALISGMSESAQISLMMNHLHGALKFNGATVLNLGLGSCYPYHTVPTTITPERDRECAAGYVANSTLTIVRDRVAYDLMNSIGAHTELGLCPVFHAFDHIAPLPQGKPRIVINYMTTWPLAESHQRMQVHPSAEKWTRALRTLVEKRSGEFDFLFSCHNSQEEKLAKDIAPGAIIARPYTAADYEAIARGAVACIAGRIHCAIPLASLGVPGLAIGSDTRMLTCNEIGLNSIYVEDVDREFLDAELDRLVASHDDAREKLQALKQKSREDYVELIAPLLDQAAQRRASRV